MNLLLIEMDGLDCIADHHLRLSEVTQLKRPPNSNTYLRRLYDLTLLALDEPIRGAREYMDYLMEHKWRVIILTQRLRTRKVYHATLVWLKEHGFDDFSYELVLKEPQYLHMSIVEWKVTKIWWYTQESLSVYKSIVLIDPHPRRCDEVQERWNSFADRPLLTYSSLTEFSTHLLRFEQERKFHHREQQRLIQRWEGKGISSLQETAIPAGTREAIGEAVKGDNLEPSLPSSSTVKEAVESVYEQEHGALELLEESPQLEMDACIVEVVEHDGQRDEAEVQHPVFFEEEVQEEAIQVHDDDCEDVLFETEIESEDEEDQQQYEPLSSRKGAMKGRRQDNAYNERDESHGGKKHFEQTRRKRKAVRSVKETVLSGSED